MNEKHTCPLCGREWRCKGYETCEERKFSLSHFPNKDEVNCTCDKCSNPTDEDCVEQIREKVIFT